MGDLAGAIFAGLRFFALWTIAGGVALLVAYPLCRVASDADDAMDQLAAALSQWREEQG